MLTATLSLGTGVGTESAGARSNSDPAGWINWTLARPDAVLVIGWADDIDTDAPVAINIFVDGDLVRSSKAQRRHEGRAAKGQPANVGFRVRVPVSAGVHRLCVRATNVGAGQDRSIGCRRVTTTPVSPSQNVSNDEGLGVLVSPTGVILPIKGATHNGFAVSSPCGFPIFTTAGRQVLRTKVVVDAGHGGSEPGAVGPNGLVERDVNLSVSREVLKRLRWLGIPTQPTRTADYRLPIRTRGEIANALDADLFISVHHNGGATRRSSDPGNEAWYSTTSPESLRLARILWEEQYQALSPLPVAWVDTSFAGASVRLNTSGEDFFGIHRYTPDVPSVISEFVYLSNAPEAELMAQRRIVDLEARTIVSSVLRWYWGDETDGRIGATWTADTSTGTGGFENCKDPELGL